MTIRDLIEKWANDAKAQQMAEDGFCEGSCRDYYVNGLELGALWAMRWCLVRYRRLKWLNDPSRTLEECHKFKPERLQLWRELDAAAAEILERAK